MPVGGRMVILSASNIFAPLLNEPLFWAQIGKKLFVPPRIVF
jgi:hypothetical protein